MTEDNENNGIAEEFAKMFTTEKDESGQVQVVRELFDSKKSGMITHIRSNLNESFYFSTRQVLGNILGLNPLNIYLEEERLHRISHDRLGRKEAVDMARTHPPETERKGIFNRLLGR